MNGVQMIGEITVKDFHEIEWKIKDIWYKGDDCYNSPFFTVSGIEWCLSVYPNEETEEDVGWISFHLHKRYNTGPALGVRFAFGLKTGDGSVKELMADTCWVFDEEDSGFGDNCLLKSELFEQKFDLAPSNYLTVICTMWVKNNVDSPIGSSYDLTGFIGSEKYSDVTLKVKSEEFPAHKIILVARSSTFSVKFGADSGEKIVIEDCEPEVFKDFLSYLYSGRFAELSCSPFDLYEVANEFNVRDLMADCLIWIMINLTSENFCEAAVLAEKFDIDPLRIKCEDFFYWSFAEIIPSEKWQTLLAENTVLAGDLLKFMADREAELKIFCDDM